MRAPGPRPAAQAASSSAAAPGHATGPVPQADISAALRAQQTALHLQNAPWAGLGAMALGLMLVAALWRSVHPGVLLAWLGVLGLVMASRLVLWLVQRRRPPATLDHRRWRTLYRANYLAHGLVWAGASALPIPADAPLQLALLVVMLAGIVASNFVLNAYDLRAALLFGVPTMGALVLRLGLSADTALQLMALAVLLALGFFTVVGQRAHRMVRENAMLRLADQRQNHLLRLLIETTSEGFWFIDDRAVTVDANPAMCRILGLPREAVVGRGIYDFVDAENRAVFQREMAQRNAGAVGGYEISLRRPDGSLVHCFNHATPLFDPQGQRAGSVGMWTDISERKRAERQLQDTTEELRRQRQALADTLQSVSQGLVSYDAQGRLQTWNQQVLDMMGLPASLFTPQATRSDIVRWQAARGDLAPGSEFLDLSGQPQPLPADLEALPDAYVRRTPAGALVEVRTRRLPGGGTVRTFADVTAYIEAQRALAARERELAELLDAFPGFIVATDSEGRYVYANQRFADMLGRPRTQIVGRHGAEVLGAERFAQVRAVLDTVRPGQPVTRESEYPATPWRPRMFLQVTHAISQGAAGAGQRLYAFAIDVTARKTAETALVAARDEAQRANRAKSQFLSGMSHELRTPLNAILGFGHLLAHDRQHPLAPAQRQQMQAILDGAQHLLQLINEVLDLAVVESGSLRVQLQPVALRPALAEALALVRPLAQDRGIHLLPLPGQWPEGLAADGAAGAAVQADPVRLKQVLLNLLGNAIKYNRPQGRVQLHCDRLAEDGDGDGPGAGGWRITVQDTGPGLSPEQQGRLFAAFDRLGAERQGVEGTGLGLALSRGLVRAMGGEIGVLSQPGAGSSFWLRLPAAADMAGAALAAAAPAALTGTPPAAPSAAPAATTPAGAPLQAADAQAPTEVLYIDDNPVNLMLMQAVFERLPGLQLHTADDPVDGLRMAFDRPPQLVLLDIQLPGMDGHEVLRRLREHPHTRHLPVLAVSADAMPEAVQRGLDAGFNDYLTKPVDNNRLVAAVRAALAGH